MSAKDESARILMDGAQAQAALAIRECEELAAELALMRQKRQYVLSALTAAQDALRNLEFAIGDWG